MLGLGKKRSRYYSGDDGTRLKHLLVTYSQVLLEHNAKVYMAARDRKKAEGAIEELKGETGREALFLELNLANLASVRKAAESFLKWVNFLCCFTRIMLISFEDRRKNCMSFTTMRARSIIWFDCS